MLRYVHPPPSIWETGSPMYYYVVWDRSQCRAATTLPELTPSAAWARFKQTPRAVVGRYDIVGIEVRQWPLFHALHTERKYTYGTD